VEGLINIDKTKALSKLRASYTNDSSAKIRLRVIELAGEVGSSDDLTWLAEKLGSTEGERAWQAMLTIFKAVETDVLAQWVQRLGSLDYQAKLSDEQKISFLELAERKANGEKRQDLLQKIRRMLAKLYSTNGRFEQAAKCLGLLREGAGSAEEKERILAEVLEVYLKWPKEELAAQLVDNCLLEEDLEPNSSLVLSFEKYLKEPNAISDPNVVWRVLTKIKTAKDRPMWDAQVQRWTERFGWVKDVNKPN
jgi:hypothetical protein